MDYQKLINNRTNKQQNRTNKQSKFRAEKLGQNT